MSDSIKVAIRVRPLIKREKDENLPVQWTTQGNAIVATDAEMKKRGDGGFQFDHIFDTTTNNNDIFDNIVRPIVDAAVNGFNGTVFAYGQTSSGKTYTMMGTSEEPGVIPLAIEHMFDAIANTPGREFLLRVSYLEIYNERVNDLLCKDFADLKVHEDINGQVFVKCKEEVTNCPENVLSFMNKGNKNRRIGETNMNERSSRSHTIFRITIESRAAGSDSDGAIQVSQLNMVDLAGSERARQTGATGERLKEGRHINLSLSTLALVIMQLSESPDSQKYINFRDSKLTRLLQASLGGNAMTAIICAVTPAALEETQCTLSFAARAKHIKNKPELNEVMSDGVLLKRYAKQIDKLHTELERMKQQSRSADFQEMESKMQEKDRINQTLEERIRLLQTRIVTADNRNSTESFKIKEKRRQTWCGGGFKRNTSVFRSTANLSPIKEMSPIKLHGRKSSDIHTSFQIAFADFELELMNSEAAREEENESDEDIHTFVTRRKTNYVNDDKIISVSPVNYDNYGNTVSQKTDTSTQTISNESPGTPKQTLRERIQHLGEEYSQLREFTMLEKQIYIEDQSSNLKEKLAKVSILEKQCENLASDKDAFEHIACELRKKLTAAELRYTSVEDQLNAQAAELQKIPNLEQRVAQLSACELEMPNIAELQNHITILTAEKDGYEHVASELRKKLNEAERRNILLEDKLATQNIELEKSQSSLEGDNMQQELVESQITTVVSEKDELQRVITDLQDKLIEAQSCNNTMKNKLDEQEQKLQTLQDLEERVSNFTSEKNVLEFTICEMKKKLKEAEETNDSIRVKLNEQQLEILKFQNQEKQIEKLTFQNQELKLTISEQLIAVEEINDSMKDKTDECQQDVYTTQYVEKPDPDVAKEKMKLGEIDELKEKLERKEVMNKSMKNALSVQEQENRDLEKQIEDFTIEKNKFEGTVAELKEKLKEAEVMNSLLKSKLNEYETNMCEMDSLEAVDKTLVSDKTFEHTISELQEELKKAELKDIEQEKYIENFTLERSKLEDTVRELEKKSEEMQLHNNLLKNKINEQELQLQRTRDLEKEIECLTSKTKEFETTIDELREKLANAEHCISAKDELVQQQSQKIPELETQIVKLTSERDKYEQMESHRQSMKSPGEETSGDRGSDDDINRLNNRISDLQSIIQEVQRENTYLKERAPARLTSDHEYDLSNGDTLRLIEDLSITRASLEEDSAKLSADLVLKNQELDEIKHDVQNLKATAVALQDTVGLLTTENSDLANKLTTEKECAEELTARFQKRIDELYARNSEIMDEKIDLENNMRILNEQMETLRSRMPEVNLNEEQMIHKYEEQIGALTARNIELLSDITDKTRELEMLKESKSLLYEHDCIYKDKLTELTEKYEYLITENNELSTDIMDKVEENDGLKKEYDILKSKLESLKNKEDAGNNDAEQPRAEDAPLKTDENMKVSDQLIETIENPDDAWKNHSFNNTLCLPTLFNDTLTTNDMMDSSIKDDNAEAKILKLQEEINHLTHLNRKLSDLKLGTCTECIHLKEIIESRRSLKLEVKVLSRKLEDSQRKFDSEFAKKDALMLKAKEDVNISISNSSFNASFFENMNVSFVEERLQSLSNELRDLKEDHDRLSDMYREKCHDLEELQNSTVADLTQATDANSSLKKASGKTSLRIENIERVVRDLENDFAKIKQDNVKPIKADLAKFTNEKESLLGEINSLKTANEQLLQKLSESKLVHTTAQEKTDILENEITDMTKKLQEVTVRCKEMENAKLLLEIEAESLKEDKSMKERTINELRQSLSCLQHEMDIIRKEKEECKKYSSFIEQEYERKLKLLEATNEELTNSKATISQELVNYRKSEDQLTELNEKINKYTSENDYLKQELIKLRDIENKFEKMRNEYQSRSQQDKTLAEDNKKFNNILNDTSKNIIKEIKSLKPKVNTQEFVDKSVNDLFHIFLQTILAKEKEIVTTMREQFDKDKQKLEDEKQQSVDVEKRTRLWAKELENETEKLQTDLSEREITSDRLQKEIACLKQLLEENDHDRDVLREKLSLLETDFNNLQIEFNKYAKIDTVNEEAIIVAQKREKQAQEAVKTKEAEFQVKLKSEKEVYNKRIEDLTRTIETFKTKNMELMSNIEGLEANQEHQKNIIDLKINELMKNSHIIQKMRIESEQLTEAYNDLNHDLEEKKLRIAEITELLKVKCDELTEYKANLQTIVSENDLLKQQISERKASIEQYKMQIETLKMENKKELDEIKDELKFEELKGVELNKQIAELSNKNIALTEEIDILNANNAALQCKCTSLERRARNSTSKILAEEKMEELRDLNRSLRNNLDGASNRITELQDAKNELMQELVALNSQYDAACKDNHELKELLASYKSKYGDKCATNDKYDLIQEKNKIALELEATKVQLNQKNKDIESYVNTIEELTQKNVELDRELDELADVIREHDAENARLQDQYYSCRAESDELQDRIKALEKKNRDLQSQSTQKTDTSNASRAFSERSFNEECNCTTLKSKIRELQLEIVSKNGKIATLELQIRSGSFPYQMQCRELQEHLSAQKNKNSELKAEVKRLQMAMIRTSAEECNVCKQRFVNRRNQACQTIPNNVLRFCSTSSGIIDDEARILKLEKEKQIMKDLCRSRSRAVKELEKRIEEYEKLMHSVMP